MYICFLCAFYIPIVISWIHDMMVNTYSKLRYILCYCNDRLANYHKVISYHYIINESKFNLNKNKNICFDFEIPYINPHSRLESTFHNTLWDCTTMFWMLFVYIFRHTPDEIWCKLRCLFCSIRPMSIN